MAEDHLMTRYDFSLCQLLRRANSLRSTGTHSRMVERAILLDEVSDT